jgi:outer membrane immunogenic protein
MSPAPPPPMMAPPMMFDSWQGLYAGANLGVGIDSSSFNLSPTGCFLLPAAAANRCGGGAASNAPRTFSGSLHQAGFLGGIQGGYNWHFSPSWMLGLETDFDGGGLSGTYSTQVTPLAAPLTGTNQRNISHDESYLGTVRGRLGFIPSPAWLLYGTGGFAYGKINAGSSLSFSTGGDSYAGGSSNVKTGWTAGGGLEYAFAPQWSLSGEYLYVHLGSSTFTDVGLNAAATTATNPQPTFRTSMSNNENVLRVALNYHFGAPPPPPAPIAAPAPPPAAPKVFIVFFDWDRDTITPEGQQIIQQASDAYKAGAPVQIQITGYTDRSGSAGYNQRLSERRANNVARAMAALGVPKEQMVVSGRGENDNRVPTADGVREPQNRRVEIVSP